MLVKKFALKPATHKETEAKLLQALQILKRLRETSTLWQTHFGVYKQNMLTWERNADKFLSENIVEVEVEEQPKILTD